MLSVRERCLSHLARDFGARFCGFSKEAILIQNHCPRRTRHLPTALFVFALTGLSATCAVAQPWPNTQSVNDCTLIPEPDQMRRCIEAYQGAPAGPSSAPVNSPLLLPQPSPSPQPTRPPGQAAPPRLAPR
jgi:hypothetical protein